MGKLVPHCVVANNNALYSIARATRHSNATDVGKPLVALLKSDSIPATSLSDTKWSLVSTTPMESFETLFSTQGLPGFFCTVDDDGIFSMRFNVESLYIRYFSYDPNAPLDPALKTVHYSSENTTTTRGEWVDRSYYLPAKIDYGNEEWITPDKATVQNSNSKLTKNSSIYFSYPMPESLDPFTDIPTISYGYLKATVPDSDSPRKTKVPTVEDPSTIYKAFDKQQH
ncbi:hypothetical protein BGZ83_009635 [Gryganskiella cystojenkinii]|nr:hypothetical protein BGZ83_009635 [Gryganskiella cystojenkinii]